MVSSPEHHIRCLAHVINLAVKEVLLSFDDKICALRTFIKGVRWSDVKFSRLKVLCAHENPPVSYVKPTLDVPTRWNSTQLMLQNALSMKEPLKRLLREFKNDFPDEVKGLVREAMAGRYPVPPPKEKTA